VASAIGLVIACYVLLYHLAPLVLSSKGLFANRELTVLLAIAVGLGASWAAHAMGISPALGAFLAGMILGESPYAAQVRADIGALRTIMVTLFFASIGMLAKPTWFFDHMHWVLPAAGLVFIIKVLVMTAVGRLFGLTGRYALATGISLGQIGEFSFVLTAAARQGGLVEGDMFNLIVSTIILLLFASPYMVSAALPAADRIFSLFSKGKQPYAALKSEEQPKPSNRVLIIGFGPAGQQVVQHLQKFELELIIIDVNPESRKTAQNHGLHIHLGDASNEEILIHAGLANACMAVVTIPDPATSVGVVETLKRLRPEMPVAARCRYNRHFDTLKQAGADILVDEESDVGRLLAHQIVDIIS
jgi:CPA2 family monovalent cation:H+ antiporter-2